MIHHNNCLHCMDQSQLSSPPSLSSSFFPSLPPFFLSESLSVQPRVIWNSVLLKLAVNLSYACLCLPAAGLTGVSHRIQLPSFLVKNQIYSILRAAHKSDQGLLVLEQSQRYSCFPSDKPRANGRLGPNISLHVSA